MDPPRQQPIDAYCVTKPADYGFVGIWEDDARRGTTRTLDSAAPRVQQRDVRDMLVRTTVEEDLASSERMARVARPFLQSRDSAQHITIQE